MNGTKGEVLSFEEAEKALRFSLRFDESDFVEGGQHPGLTVERFLGIESLVFAEGGRKDGGLDLETLWEEFGLDAIRRRGLKYLSTGELRKVLLFKVLLEGPSLLVCQDLLEGLDARSRQEVTRFFQRLTEGQKSEGEPGQPETQSRLVPQNLPDRQKGLNGQGTLEEQNQLALQNQPEKLRSFEDQETRIYRRSPSLPAVLFLCDREDQILPSVTHVLRLKDGRVDQIERWEGKKKQRNVSIFPTPFAIETGIDNLRGEDLETNSALGQKLRPPPYGSDRGEPLIHMKNIHVAYADRVVFDGLDFELYPGEHCFIQGPNGCGKSTLVKLIDGRSSPGMGERDRCGRNPPLLG